MRILLDENIPIDLASDLVGHDVDTVEGLGWAGIANGKLLSRASGKYDKMLTGEDLGFYRRLSAKK